MPVTPALDWPALGAAVKHEFWRRANLGPLLHSGQQPIRDKILAHVGDWTLVVAELARKFGKTVLFLAMLAEQCLRWPGERFVYGAPTYVQLREFAFPVLSMLEETAPPELRPRFREDSSHWTFPNKSWVHLFACDDIAAAKRGRGPKARWAVFDEAGHVPSNVLEYVLTDVFRPSLMLCEAPLTILSSTPPETPGHHFTKLADVAFYDGRYFHRTVHDNPMLTKQRVEAIAKENARELGMTPDEYLLTPGWRREYLAERAYNESLLVCPEFQRVGRDIVGEFERPSHFDLFLSMDPGATHDAWGVLFAVTDFVRRRLLIEHEIWRQSVTSDVVDDLIWGVMRDHYMRDGNVPIEPRAAVADDPSGRIVADLWSEHRLSFAPAEKVDRDAADNLWRVAIGRQEVLIHPRCQRLIHQLKTGLKNPRTGDFERDSDGHLDLLASLRYLVRAWSSDKDHNPFPVLPLDPTKVAFRPPQRPKTLLSVMRGGLRR